MKKFPQLLLFFIFNIIYSQQTELKVLNTSINTKYAELGVTLANNNKIIFASSKKNNTDKRHNNRQLHLELYIGEITANGDIIQSSKFSNELNNKFYESDIAFTPDYKTIYFTWNNFYNTQQRKDSTNWKTLFLFKAAINNNFEISEITPLPFNSKKYNIRSPFVSANGKKLYFISDMPSGYGETDIYEVDIINNDKYGEPKNLGETINTKEAEIFPFVDNNNTLYFSSYGHKGNGGLDIFKSEFKDGTYQKVESLPEPINSKYDDFAYVINSSNKAGYFTSNRKEGKGDVDIYAFTSNIKECIQNITCVFYNKLTSKNLDHVKITVFENNLLIDNQLVTFGNSYSVKLKCNTTYKFIAEKEGFETNEFEVKTTNESNNIDKKINLTPIDCNQTITGLFFNAKTNEQLTNVQVSMLDNNQLQNFGNSYSAKLKCNKTYTFIAQKEGFEPAEIEVITTKENETTLEKNINLIPVECNQTITGLFFNKNTNELLDNVSVTIFNNNIATQKQNIKLGDSYNFNLKCNETYKITAQKEGFNTAEIEVKTTDKNEIILEKNINLTPIECNQTITGLFFNKNTNELLDNVFVTISNNNIITEKQNIKLGDSYSFNLKCNETYKITAQKEDFETAEEIIISTNINNSKLTKPIYLTPIICEQQLAGVVLDIETKKPLVNAKVEVYEGTNVKILPLNAEGNFNFTLKCKTPYKINTSLKDYTSNSINLETSKKQNETLFKKIYLETNIEFVTLREEKMIKTKPIYFNLDKDEIRDDAAIELNKVVEIMHKYPNIKVEIKSHTDSRAPDNYNLELSNKRASATINYIISRNIDANRISGKGYGETELINKCSNGVKCTEAEHELNRRTEFIVIEE